MTSQEEWDKTKSILQWMAQELRNSPHLPHKTLENRRGFLVYVSNTYPSMIPYLKSLHSPLTHGIHFSPPMTGIWSHLSLKLHLRTQGRTLLVILLFRHLNLSLLFPHSLGMYKPCLTYSPLQPQPSAALALPRVLYVIIALLMPQVLVLVAVCSSIMQYNIAKVNGPLKPLLSQII
jgi:hypothetical protein